VESVRTTRDPSLSGGMSRFLRTEFREGLQPWVILPLLMSGIVLALLDAKSSVPPSSPFFGMMLLAVTGISIALRRGNRTAAAVVLHIGAALLIVLAICWFPEAMPQYAMIFLCVSSALTLGAGACIAFTLFGSAAIAICYEAAGVLAGGTPALVTALATLASVAYLMFMFERAQRGFLGWLWEAHQRNRDVVETMRERQRELKQALADLDLANREVIRLNDLLVAAREAIEEARRAKENFVATVSHELRTPLNMVVGFSDEILERPQMYSGHLPEDLLNDIATIKRNAEHLSKLVDDVLDLSEADAGIVRLQREPTRIGSLLAEVRDIMSALFQRKGLQLTVSAGSDIPEIACDRVRIRQVLLNLVTNAARFTEQGGAEIRAIRGEGETIISVSDSGAGIDSSDIKRVFEPFQQGDPTIRRKHGGTGLGLAISKRFVELHGGRIWIESERGRGTTVAFTLPFEPVLPSPGARRWFSPYQAYSAAKDRQPLAVDTPQPKLLVLDPDDGLVPVTEQLVDDLEVLRVKTYDALKDALGSNTVRAMLINEIPSRYQETCSGLPDTAFDVPVICCCVPGMADSNPHIGLHGYLVKPIRRQELLDRIDRVTPQARSILVVDDDSEARQLFRRMLARADADMRVLEADNGNKALQIMREARPDVVLLDLVMPDFDGVQVLEEKASDSSIQDIPVIIVSATDPRREPVMSTALVATRRGGLSARDLAMSVGALVGALQPRFAAPASPETPAPSSAFG